MYSSPDISALLVPTGEDQVSHVETSREIVRRFNFFFAGFQTDPSLYKPENEQYFQAASKIMFYFPDQKFATDTPGFLARAVQLYAQKIGFENFYKEHGSLARFFPCTRILEEPESMLTKTPRIAGLDGRKMSKSYGNTITLSESDADIRAKTKVMVTDPARKRRSDPGNPDVCPVYDWHKLFSAEEPGRLEWVRQGCTTAGIGCIECKDAMATNLVMWIAPVRERRVEDEDKQERGFGDFEAGGREARGGAGERMVR